MRTLRLDLEGLGDADGECDRLTVEQLHAPELLDQVRAALDVLEARGLGRRFALAGICSGAYWSFHMALRDERVRAAFMINPFALFWGPSLAGGRQQLVWELGASLVGWMELTFGDRSQFVQLLVHPKYDDAIDRFVAYALHECSPKAPVYTAAREYQPALAAALQRFGFTTTVEVQILVRQLAPRVPEPKLMPAQVVGG